MPGRTLSEGLDQGLFRAFGCGAAGTEKGRRLSARSSVFGRETDFQAVSAFVEAENPAGGTTDFWMEKSHWTRYEQGSNRNACEYLRVPESVRI